MVRKTCLIWLGVSASTRAAGLICARKEYLIRINIADARHDSLIHQHGFDVAFAADQRCFEPRKIEARIQRVGPEPFSGEEVLDIFDHANTADHPFVGIREASIVGKIEPHARKVRFLARLRDEIECAGHAEMQGQPATAIDARQEVLTISSGCDELGSLEVADECSRGNLAEYALVVHDHSFDRLAQSASCEHSLENLDIG